tara:strand:- start:17 stop:643 length:627 start_codon:yes stop_codon:yes gene_type:complete
MFGFGAFAKANGFDFMLAVMTTFALWALPGQVVFAELYQSGSLVVVFLGVFFANARFCLLAVATIPMLEGAARFRWVHFLYAHLMSVISWSQLVKMAPTLPQEDRIPYFIGFTVTMICIACIATGSGFLAAGYVPGHLGLVFLVIPAIYFILISAAARTRLAVLAVLLGGICVPAVELVLPNWGLVLGGVLAGTAAFALETLWRNRHG